MTVDPTQTLPPELLAEILGHESATDILRVSQVNHAFRDVILASPVIQHKIDLFAAGFEDNVAAGLSLVEKREALRRYRSNLDSLRPIEERRVDNVPIPDKGKVSKAAGGVYTIATESVRLFTLGSPLRGIPYKEWEIPLPLPGPDLGGYGFYPCEDVIAFVELGQLPYTQIGIHLRTLSNGGHHPAARCPSITYSRGSDKVYCTPSVSITSSRLAVQMGGPQDGVMCMKLVIWDWKSAHVLFELENGNHRTVEFIDDRRLLAGPGSQTGRPPFVALIDTEKAVGGAPVQTLFRFSQYFRGIMHPSILLERGVHKPSPAESSATFHQDLTQRIVAVNMPFTSVSCLVFRLEALLGLAEGLEGCEIEWDGWKDCVVVPSISRPNRAKTWVSGSRLFSVTSPCDSLYTPMEVYDFSIRGRTKYLNGKVDTDIGAVRSLSPTGVKVQLRQVLGELIDANGGHDSAVTVRLPDDSDTDGGVLGMWTF